MYKLPYKYDSLDQSVQDSNGTVVCIVGWPGTKKSQKEINLVGDMISQSLNHKNTPEVKSKEK